MRPPLRPRIHRRVAVGPHDRGDLLVRPGDPPVPLPRPTPPQVSPRGIEEGIPLREVEVGPRGRVRPHHVRGAHGGHPARRGPREESTRLAPGPTPPVRPHGNEEAPESLLGQVSPRLLAPDHHPVAEPRECSEGWPNPAGPCEKLPHALQDHEGRPEDRAHLHEMEDHRAPGVFKASPRPRSAERLAWEPRGDDIRPRNLVPPPPVFQR